ncbi:hypothetical protein KKA53_00695 [Candidatus Dependentiae bacterium]|nr:hypothetical protein [Candidatus Dependentiae bacterium]
MIYRLTIFLLLLVSNLFAAQDYTEKTFLLPQPIRIPTQSTFYDYTDELIARGESVDVGHFQATAFYQESTNKKQLGVYFGRNGRSEVCIDSGTSANKTSFKAENFIFTDDQDSLQLKGTMQIAPWRRVEGIHLVYSKRLTKISKRLFIMAHAPVVQVTHCLGVCATDERTELVEGRNVGVVCYFRGHLQQKLDPYKQAPLRCARMTCCKRHCRSGVADVELLLGHQFSNNDQYYLSPRAIVVIPTGNKSTGACMFEPVVGHGQHWGVGFGVEAMTVFKKTDATKIDLTCAYNIKQFFSNTQRRTLGFRSDDWSSVRAWSHYELLGESGKYGVFPAANVLTQDVKVRPGLLFDCSMNLNIWHKNCLVNFGYNYFSRAGEDVLVRCWDDDRYALVNPSTYVSTDPFTIAPDPDFGSDHNLEGPIQRAMLSTEVAASPPAITHKFYGLASYVHHSAPLTLGLGGAYEFSQDNAALEGYELYFKLGWSF